MPALPRLEVRADDEVAKVDPQDPEARALIVELLAGMPISSSCLRPGKDGDRRCATCIANEQLKALPAEWTLGVMNQALLLCEEAAVSAGFYEAFFTHQVEGGEDPVKVGLTQFRAYALLAYGNVRYSFNTLRELSRAEIETRLGEHAISPQEWADWYKAREHGHTLIEPEMLPIKDRWYLGYLSSELVVRDRAWLAALRRVVGTPADENAPASPAELVDQAAAILTSDPKRVERWKDRIDEKGRDVRTIDADIKSAQRSGTLFTAAYLAARHIDVYVATSMRDAWDFQGTAETIDQVFGTGSRLRDLDVTYFDPTISYTDSRIDKGLIEGLMLRRARVTLYMVQESDTLGKDSELAATLAHGKPVIAYLPDRSEDELTKDFNAAPLGRTWKRMLALLAEGKLPQADISSELWNLYRDAPAATFSLDPVEEKDFQKEHADELAPLYRLVAKAERKAYKSRLSTFTQKHPLALQLQHRTGVASGLLVARSVERCVALLEAVLLNTLAFEIGTDDNGVYLYEVGDHEARVPYRAMTRDPILMNAFWHFWNSPSPTPRNDA